MNENEYKSLSFDELADRICERKDTLILFHARPDGDAVGSALSLKIILERLGMNASLACESRIPERLEFIPDHIGYSEKSEFIPERRISVDTASPSQLGAIKDEYIGKVDLMIDHHASGHVYADNYIDTKSCAAGEIIALLAFELEKRGYHVFDEKLAYALYSAISSDSGCFKYSNATPRTHEIAAKLIETGIDSADINHRLFESKSLKQLCAEAEGFSHLTLVSGGKGAIVSFPYELKKKYDLLDEHLETLIDVPRSILGVIVAAAIRENEDGEYRVSLRSSANINVAAIAEKYGGGGHVRAAGLTLKCKSIDDATDIIKSEFEKVLY